eukprot:5876890-Pleurochrysis_carterae.AAC.1
MVPMSRMSGGHGIYCRVYEVTIYLTLCWTGPFPAAGLPACIDAAFILFAFSCSHRCLGPSAVVFETGEAPPGTRARAPQRRIQPNL